ncbi:hypothetical protein CBL13_04227 [Pseudomonas putida]|nr:hypothetical protein CBL13_04227 [Pseudomonas putida]
MTRQGLPGQHLDSRQQLHFIRTHQRNRLALVARPPGTPDAVHVVFGNDRQVKVDDQRQVIDIQATGRHIGRHQHLHLTGLEAVQRTLAGRLWAVTVDAVGIHAFGQQALHQLIDAIAGLGEHQHLLPALLAQQVAEQVGLTLLVHRHQPLLDAGGRGVARAHFDTERVIQRQPRQHANLIGEGGGKQQRLALARQCRIHRLQLFGKAQVKHAVGFIQHQGLHLVELHGVLPEQVEQAARGSHQQVDTPAQAHHLWVDTDPAIHRVSTQRQVLGVFAHVVVHLLGQLASGYQHQGADRVAGHLLALQRQALQHRQGKACGLAGTGLGCGHQVAAGQHGGDGFGLHRGRGGVVQLLQRAQQRFDQAEFGEIHGNTVRGFSEGGKFTASPLPTCRFHLSTVAQVQAPCATAAGRSAPPRR